MDNRKKSEVPTGRLKKSLLCVAALLIAILYSLSGISWAESTFGDQVTNQVTLQASGLTEAQRMMA